MAVGKGGREEEGGRERGRKRKKLREKQEDMIQTTST